MAQITLKFELLSPWVVATGRGDGLVADATVLRSPGGLPYLPGRSVKGLLREAARQAVEFGHLERVVFESWFGGRTQLTGQPREDSQPGALRCSDATLPSDYEAYAGQNREWARAFTTLWASVSLEGGIAKDKHLRSFEASVPMALTATVDDSGEGDAQGDWVQGLTALLPLVRGLGAHRTRGFGRVQVEVVS